MAREKEAIFREADRPDVALITNHGYAGVEVPVGGAPDTGGQVVYVNALAGALEALGYRVTIFARGGFPHFKSDRIRGETQYLSDHARYVFVPGGGDDFIRKEDIAVALDEEVDWLDAFVREEARARDCPPWAVYEFVSTHYWDAAVMGVRLIGRWRNDVAAAALADLLTGSVPDVTLDRVKAERHWRKLGEAPAYHLGDLLIEEEGSEATPLIQRVQGAAGRWVEASWQARDADAGIIVDAVERALADAEAGRTCPTSEAQASTPPALQRLLAAEATGEAILGLCRGRAERLERDLDMVDRHVWTPHSLGALKQENFRDRPPEVCRDLKFCERRSHEQTVCARTRAFAATSTEISERLRTQYRVPSAHIFYYPPGVDRTLFREYTDEEESAAYRYLADLSAIPAEKLRSGRIVFETSRMDPTKRKDLLLDAFVRVSAEVGDAYLFIGGGPENDLFRSLVARRDALPELRGRAFLTGFIPEEYIGPLFSIAQVYASASEMEGFGMSASQAAAAGAALVSSDLVPFAVQYVPDAALIVPAGDVAGFTDAILRLLQDEADRQKRAAQLVEKVKMLDWETQTAAFLDFLRRRGIAVAQGRMTT
jgi:glycosyltransferase involved in cell wall biosynthesis